MKNILCFGDSNTWGYDAETGDRFPMDIRWTGVLSRKLGEGYRVIEEGLNGRTTVWDDPIEGYKNGKQYLIPCLESQRPLDLVIIMLGTNDLKKRFSVSAMDIAWSLGSLADVINKSGAGYQGKPPKVLLLSPILVGDLKLSPFGELFDGEESIQTARRFAVHIKRIADQYGCEFLDAAEYADPSSVDAIHFDADGHRKLGEAVAAKVRKMV